MMKFGIKKDPKAYVAPTDHANPSEAKGILCLARRSGAFTKKGVTHMPPIHNVTVQRDLQGGTTLLAQANGQVNGVQIDVTPAGGPGWVPPPVFGSYYYISDGTGQQWMTTCTTPPANAMATGYFTVTNR